MRFYNTLTRKKEEFVPITEGQIKMYSCGPTVYNFFHLGNARPFIVFDTLRRYFEYRGYKVDFVQNFTDIDDKVIKKANEEGISAKELADKYIEEYFIDARGLSVKEATFHPRATEVIPEIIKMCETLIEKGFAYEIDGDVYFETKKFSEYGKLSNQPLDELEAGARISVSEYKKDPMDFVLWKAKKENEPFWQSPWGEGRPGWHIECSAMVNKYLGKTIDIHGGGKDLTFPHHENEAAQSKAANGANLANYWLHNGYINIDNKKMSKSLNNFFTVREISRKFPYNVIRFFLLSAHYRSPVNFSDSLLTQSQTALARILNCMDNLKFISETAQNGSLSENDKEILDGYKNKFIEAMDDDLNTADAVSYIFELVREINTKTQDNTEKEYISYAKVLLDELTDVLGIYKETEKAVDTTEIEKLISERTKAKKEKDFKKADEIREQLTKMGVVIEDTREGVKWKIN